MTTSVPGLHPVVVGANHRSSSLALRDALFVDDAAQPAFLETLKRAGLLQALAVSTCDRVEVLAFAADTRAAARAIAGLLGERAGWDATALTGQLYVLEDTVAVRHCFGVAASLDSLVIGEPQVLGQVKACHRLARAAGLCGSEMEALLAAAYGAAKRVRTETAVAERPVSIASAAVELARDLHGDFSACDALMVGAGDMGGLIGESLQAAGLRRLVATAPRASQAEALAGALRCHVGAFEALPDLLAEADIVVTALGARQPVIGAELVHKALRRRKKKPIFLVDAGIPGDVDVAVNRLDGVFLYDLSDLERVAMQGRASREAAARDAWKIVDDEVARFVSGRAGRAAVPAIVALRGRFEQTREQVLAEAGDDAAKATRLLVARLLHDPSEAMKAWAAEGAPDGEWAEAERVLQKLFRLDEPEA